MEPTTALRTRHPSMKVEAFSSHARLPLLVQPHKATATMGYYVGYYTLPFLQQAFHFARSPTLNPKPLNPEPYSHYP